MPATTSGRARCSAKGAVTARIGCQPVSSDSSRSTTRRRLPGTVARLTACVERGQSTVEYALVLLGAAAIAMGVIAWVTRSGMIGRLFDAVLGQILQQAG